MTAKEFLKDMTHLQDDYMAMRMSGFYRKKNEIRILDPIMQKYGMSYEEAEQAARNRLSLREYLRIINRKEEQNAGTGTGRT